MIERYIDKSEQSSEQYGLVETPCVVEVTERKAVEVSVMYPVGLDVVTP